MRVAVVHGPRVCLCSFGLDPNQRQKPRSNSEAKRQQRIGTHVRFVEAKHHVDDTVRTPVEPSGHSRWTDPERWN